MSQFWPIGIVQSERTDQIDSPIVKVPEGEVFIPGSLRLSSNGSIGNIGVLFGLSLKK